MPGSRKLFAIRDVISSKYLEKINSVDWLHYPWQKDPHWAADDRFCRRELAKDTVLLNEIDQQVALLLPEISKAANKDYVRVGSSWYLCEPTFVCPMHTDGRKANVMIMYWKIPGPEFGTTFYNSNDPNDVFYEFASVPNTGFFVDYEPDAGEPWSDMWHASLLPVPPDTYRLMTLYELYTK